MNGERHDAFAKTAKRAFSRMSQICAGEVRAPGNCGGPEVIRV